MNRALSFLHGGSLESMLTVPLIFFRRSSALIGFIRLPIFGLGEVSSGGR